MSFLITSPGHWITLATLFGVFCMTELLIANLLINLPVVIIMRSLMFAGNNIFFIYCEALAKNNILMTL